MSKKILRALQFGFGGLSRFYLKLLISAVFLFSAVICIFSSELMRVIDEYEEAVKKPVIKEKTADRSKEIFESYEFGDWEKYIHESEKPIYSTRSSVQDESILIDFKMPVTISYGDSFFTRSRYKTDDESDPYSSYVTDGYFSSMNYMLKVNGYVNDSLYLNIDHDSERENTEENIYEVIYNSPDPESFLQQFKLGNIEVDFNNSKFAFYDNSSRRAMGFSTLFKKNNLTAEFFGIVNDNISAVDVFRGFKRNGTVTLREYQFVRRKFYQIEPFIRYDARTSLPDVSTLVSRQGLVAFTSDPVNAVPSRSLDEYSLSSVNIHSGSLEIYIDDQDGSNNSNSVQFSVDDGYYDKMVQGSDYTVNCLTGEVKFVQALGKKDRIIALYSLDGGSTCDPSVQIYNGKYLVFLKYGESLSTINENSPAVGYDVYEIRSRYYLGNSEIVAGSFSAVFSDEDGTIQTQQMRNLGGYGIDYDSGYICFLLREPFRVNMDDSDEEYVYSQSEISGVYRYSEFSMECTFNIDSGKVQLSHSDIVTDSVSVKTDSQPVSSTLYTVDYITGEMVFDDNYAASVSENSVIEVKYQYKNDEENESSFTTGARVDYTLNRNINLGASFLYSQDSSVYEIPDIDSAPQSNLVGEADIRLDYTADKLTKIMKPVIRGKEIPFNYSGYCEYARSVTVINTFGYGLVDGFDSPGSAMSADLDDDNWILSSPRGSELQSERTSLYYRYYRDPDDGYSLKGDGFSCYNIDYSVKPGPYNIAEGYLGKNDFSLVFDFDFNGSDLYASSVTRRLENQPVDLSSLQYVEIIYRSAGGNGTVNISLDIGTVVEDSDSDGVLDTEDDNGNGYLDYDPDAGVFEDGGYVFNPSGEPQTYVGSGPRINYQTKGDGKLTSEDINENSVLDSDEDVITFPSSKATVNGTAGQTVLPVDMTDTAWKKARIYLDRKNLTSADFEVLRKCEALRFHISATNNSVDEGRIFINSIDLIMLDWNEIRIDGIEDDDPEKLKVSYVDTAGDSEYRSCSFASEERDIYEKLYGNSSNDDVNEGALEITYSNLDGSPPNGSVTRKFSKGLDFSNYEKLNMWINVRSYTPGDIVEIVFGRNSREYFIYEYDFSSSDNWQKIEMKLGTDSSGGISPQTVIGNAELNEINYITVRIIGDAGRFWINNIYVSDPSDVTGQAFYTENSVTSSRPLASGERGTYLNNTSLKHIFKYVEGSFMSPERDDFGTEILYNSFELKTDPTEKMQSSLVYSREDKSDTDSESVRDDNFTFSYRYGHGFWVFPDLLFKYSQNMNEEEFTEKVSSSVYDTENRSDFYSFYTEFYRNNIIVGSTEVRYHLFVGSDYSKERMHRNLEEGSEADVENDTGCREQKNRYGAGLELVNDSIDMSVSCSLSNSLVNSYHGYEILQGDPIQSDVSGGFYFPLYFSDSDYKLVSRKNSLGLDLGYKKPHFMELMLNNSINSSEGSYYDYSDSSEFRSIYARDRSLTMVIDSIFKIPVTLFNNMVNFVFSYEKKSTASDLNSPYEGESENYFDENHGAVMQLGDLAGYQYNYSQYYPFYFFSGPGFLFNGRRVGERIHNNTITEEGIDFSEYDNSISVKDEFSFDSSCFFDKYTASYNFTMTNLCERKNVSGVPGQTFTLDNNLVFTFNMLKILDIYDSDTLSFDVSFAYAYVNYFLVTENIIEYSHDPEISFEYRRQMFGVSLTFSVMFRVREDREFIEYGISDPDDPDYIYSQNLTGGDFTENDKSYSVKISYSRKLGAMKDFFGFPGKSDEFPELTLDGEMTINNYDYENCVSPEPYDEYSFKADLSYGIYKYTKINIYGLGVLERYYNRDTGGLYKEVISYEIGAGLQVIF